MTTWPNWVDLIIVILLVRGCYSGFGRGLWAELLSLVGAVSAVVLTINYSRVVMDWLRPWIPWNPMVAQFLMFWGVFLIAVLAIHVLLRRVAEVIKWERFHWLPQGAGFLLGGLRGLWWSGFVLVALASSGFVYLQESVEQRSVSGPRLLPIARNVLDQVTERFPGAQYRGNPLVPAAKETPKGKAS